MLDKLKNKIKSRLWDFMDYLQVKAPRVWRFIKKRVPRPLKQFILLLLTTKNPDLMYDAQESPSKKGSKITFIVITKSEVVDLLDIFGFQALPFTDHKEFIIVSPAKVVIKKSFGHKVKQYKNLRESILNAKGDFLCFLAEGQKFVKGGGLLVAKIIEKTKADIYFGNYINYKNELTSIYNGDIKVDFSKAVLPVEMYYGIKIISRNAAIRTKIPKNGLFEYILNVTDNTKEAIFIDRPLIKNSKAENFKKLYEAQKKALDRRFIYGNKKIPKDINKILFIAPYLVIGGAEKVLLDLVCEYIEKGLKVDIFCTHGRGAWVGKFKEAGARIFFAKSKSPGRIVNEIHKLALKEEYDVIHTSNTEYGHYYSLKAQELTKRPVIVDTVHSQNNPLCKYTKTVQTTLDGIVTVNRLIKEKLSNQINPEKMKVVYNGVEIPSFKQRALKEKFENPEIVFLGRMSEEKNPLEVVKIATDAAISHPNWKFKVVGDGPLLEDAKRMAEVNGLGGKIKFVGAKQNGAQEIKDASCLILTSYTEGLPITILEAINLGIPVVSSNVGGISEVIKDGVGGYLVVNPDNTEEYIKKLEKLFNNSSDYLKICNANKLLSKKFTSKRMAEETLSFYQELLDDLPQKFTKVTTIAMLSFNRTEEIKRTIETIIANTEVPYRLLVLDNNSENETKQCLKKLATNHKNIKIIFEKKNLGCPGGRRKMLNQIDSDYIVTIDNDMEVPKNWLRDLIIRLEEDKKIMGVCVKDVFPWGKIEFTGGKIGTDSNGFALFSATHYRKEYNDLSTLEEFDCDWIPGGATLWRGNIREVAEHAKEYINAFEDFDYSLQIKRKGYRIVNCPNVIFIHNHASGFGKEKKQKEAKYLKDRNNAKGFLRSLAVFYKRTGLIIKNDQVFETIGLSLSSTPEEVRPYLEREAKDVRPMEV